ncbi:MAG: threonine-phosphate decarboxylase CobD [Eubacteriales bacterium]|nr:threonine-phosphate decarboxylase CobD [Eubacteriales bacterium]
MRGHGGDWVSYHEKYGRLPLDFSTNVSPLGLPDSVREAAIQSLDSADRYPDPQCRALRREITAELGIPSEFCLCGNGAADLLFRVMLAKKPRRALLPVPTFSEYEAALKAVDCVVETVPLSEKTEFRLSEEVLRFITPETDVLFLCEPNNPTGLTTPRELLLRILRRCRETETLLVLDECFLDFLEEPEQHTLLSALSYHPNLLILRAFTKLYAMAGLRLGYCICSDTELLRQMQDAGQPWAVSAVAQYAGRAALQETEYVHRVRMLLQKQRPRLLQALRALGLRVLPGEANYLLFQGRTGLAEALQDRGILIRCCANYDGLDASWYRIAIRTEEENTRLLAALREVLG